MIFPSFLACDFAKNDPTAGALEFDRDLDKVRFEMALSENVG